jgi:hypothetical protein
MKERFALAFSESQDQVLDHYASSDQRLYFYSKV